MGVHQNMTEQVRQYLSVIHVARTEQITKDLGMSRIKVKSTIETLIAQGTVQKVAEGVYQFMGITDEAEVEIEAKIFRAMKINPVFTVDDIARQSNLKSSFVYKRFYEYRANKYIKQSGHKSTLGGGTAKAWRMTQEGLSHAKRPIRKIFVPDPLIEETVTLNRLICTGLALADETAHETAVSLCASIMERLKNDKTT